MSAHEMNQSLIKIALFDFDDTISTGDSIIPYIAYCIRRRVAPRTQWLQALRALWGYTVPCRSLPRPKEAALSFIRGKTVEEMAEIARDFYETVLKPQLKPEALAEMESLKAKGYTILLVSASAAVYMDALRALPLVDDVLSTPCCIENGIYTGKMGADCRLEEKPCRVKAWLKEKGLAERAQIVRAYGNSTHDIPMLQLAEQAVLVSPSKKLRERMPRAAIASWQNK